MKRFCVALYLLILWGDVAAILITWDNRGLSIRYMLTASALVCIALMMTGLLLHLTKPQLK